MILEQMKIKAELARVVAARMELEYKQEEYKYHIERLGKDITIQVEKESELQQKIKEMGV
jgi:hypothetical protein